MFLDYALEDQLICSLLFVRLGFLDGGCLRRWFAFRCRKTGWILLDRTLVSWENGNRTAYVSGKRDISRTKIANIIIAVIYSVHLHPR